MTPKQVIVRMFLMAAVFIIGITVGLSVARWMKRPTPPTTPADTVQRSASVPAATRNVQQEVKEVRRNAIRGISPGELPYDGAPPPTEAAAVPQPPLTSGTSAVENYSGAGTSESDTTQRDSAPVFAAPPGEEGQGETAVEKPADAAAAPSPPAEMLKKAAQKEAAQKEAAQKEAAQKEAAQKEAAQKEAAQKEAAQKDTAQKDTAQKDTAQKDTAQKDTAQKPAAPAAAAAKKRQSARAVEKDREIERIKKQADHELRRKLETGRALEKDGSSQLARRRDGRRAIASASDARTTRVRKILAKCERNPNLLRREQCKWRLCGDSWGKNGCPSYAKPSGFY